MFDNVANIANSRAIRRQTQEILRAKIGCRSTYSFVMNVGYFIVMLEEFQSGGSDVVLRLGYCTSLRVQYHMWATRTLAVIRNVNGNVKAISSDTHHFHAAPPYN